MKISTKGRYALRIMVDIAKNSNDDFVSISSISERQNISNKYLEQIISKLSKANLVKTSRGYMGGYKLSRKPSEYKIGEILRVAEGDLNIIDCVKDNKCPRKKYCNTYFFWEGLDKVINEYVDSFTLEELIK
ncbi:MAG: RrF2 family transcriptional regulator [Bacilli bacterium]